MELGWETLLYSISCLQSRISYCLWFSSIFDELKFKNIISFSIPITIMMTRQKSESTKKIRNFIKLDFILVFFVFWSRPVWSIQSNIIFLLLLTSSFQILWTLYHVSQCFSTFFLLSGPLRLGYDLCEALKCRNWITVHVFV
jgi:hypothetical protein